MFDNYISWRPKQNVANAGIHLRLTVRLHSECTCVVTGPRVKRACICGKKSISFSILSPSFTAFVTFFHQNATILVLFSPFSFVSFYFARSIVLRKSFLKGGIYLFVYIHAVLFPLLLSFSI